MSARENPEALLSKGRENPSGEINPSLLKKIHENYVNKLNMYNLENLIN